LKQHNLKRATESRSALSPPQIWLSPSDVGTSTTRSEFPDSSKGGTAFVWGGNVQILQLQDRQMPMWDFTTAPCNDFGRDRVFQVMFVLSG